MRKRLLSVLLSLCMVLTLLPAAALATEVTDDPADDKVSVEQPLTEEPKQTPPDSTPNPVNKTNSPTKETKATYVAQIGDTKYETLEAAVQAATEATNTITLLDDVAVNAPVTVTKTTVIDGDGKYTISASDSFKNGDTAATSYVIGCKTKEITLTLKNVTVDANQKCRTVYINAGKLVIDGATITGGATKSSYIGGVYVTNAASFEMTSGDISGNAVSDAFVEDGYMQYSADLWIGANAKGEINATISGGTVGNVFVNANEYSATNPGSFTIKGGTIENLYVEYDKTYGGSFTYTDGKIENLYLSTTNSGNAVQVEPTKGRVYNGGDISAAADGTTMSLYKDISADIEIDSEDTVTLDLNGHKLTNVVPVADEGEDEGTQPKDPTHTITNHGTLTIIDSAGGGKVDNISHQKAALYNLESATATLSGGTFDRSSEAGSSNKESGGNSWYTISNQGTMIINEGVTITQGASNDDVGKFSSLVRNAGENAATMTINGGEFYKGLYSVKNDKNGTLNIQDGYFENHAAGGFLLNYYKATINEGTFVATESVRGVYNVSGTSETATGVLKIEGGRFTVKPDAEYFIQVYEEPSFTNVASASISSGHFSRKPEAQYLASGKALVQSDAPGYNYMVTDRKVDVDTKVTVAPPKVEADENLQLDEAVKDAILNALTPDDDGTGGVSADEKLAAAASNVANDDKVITEEIVNSATDALNQLDNVTITADNPVTIVVEPSIAVNVKDATVDEDNQITSLTLDIQAQYSLKATATDNNGQPVSVPVPNSEKKLDLQIVTITIPLPASFAVADGATIYVEHTKENGKNYLYAGTVPIADGGAKFLTFTNLHGFSDFVINANAAPAASITTDSGTTYYQTLQKAMDDVEDGQTIALADDNTESVTVSREVSFTLDENGKTFSGSIKAGSGYKMTEENGTYTFTKKSSSGSSGGSVTYAITVQNTSNGKVTVNTSRASKGEKVTITVTPNEGYQLDTLTATDSDGSKLTLTEGNNGKYTFTMPASKVTITASFEDSNFSLPFKDAVKGDWFYEAVAYVYKNGLMNGTDATTFSPNATTTRGMIVTILYRLEGSPAVSGASGFTDVAPGQYYANAVAWAYANKIVTGYGNGTFGPNDAITREQMASILYRYASYKGYDVSTTADLSSFTDASSISAYAATAMQWANGKGLITGVTNTTLAPTGTATRAQVATILMRFCENLMI